MENVILVLNILGLKMKKWEEEQRKKNHQRKV